MTESDLSTDGTCSSKMGDRVIEIDDVEFIMEACDERFHSWMTGRFIMTDVTSSGEKLFNRYISRFYRGFKIAIGIITSDLLRSHRREDILT
jgi:hypothetical protein